MKPYPPNICTAMEEAFIARAITEKDGLSDNVVRSILEDHEGNLWFGTDGGICRYNGKIFTNFTEKEGLSSNAVWSMIEDREGSLWIGTYRGGIDKFRRSPFTHITTKEGLSDNVVRSIWEDREGNLWFGTYKGGISKFDGKNFTHLSTKNGLVDNFVLTISEDREGNLWFGTYRGVSKFNGKTFTNLTEKDGLSDNVVRSILEDQRGNFWFGTDKEGIYKYDGVTFTRFTTKEGLNDNEILTIFEDSKGKLWIGTKRGINTFNGKNFMNFSEKHGLEKNESIYVILEDTEGNLWFGTYGGGIIKYIPSRTAYEEQGEQDAWDGLFETFATKDGLHNNNIVLMIFDNAGNLWIGSEKGIDKLNIEHYKKTGRKVFKHYGREEDFTGMECIHNSVCQDSKGNIWFGTLRGAVKYTARDDKPNKKEPLTHIAGLRLFFEEVEWSNYPGIVTIKNGLPRSLKLPHNQNHITLDFIGISLVSPEKVKYQYKLEGFDKTWSPVVKETYASYSNLSPGKYTFNVRACNNNGIWNKEPITYSFEITPPFWMTWWFYVFTFLLIVGVIHAYIKLRIKRLEKINLELEKLTLVASKTENAVMIADATGLIEWVNEGFTRMTGYTLEELRESKRDTLAEVSSNPKIEKITDKSVVDKKSIIYESLNYTKGGKKLWISSTLTPIFHKNGELKKLVVISTNLTERKQAEEEKEKLQAQLIQAEKMAGIGTLTSGIAHEFNNLLQIMRGHAEFAQKTKKAPDMEEALDIVVNTSDRVTKIIADLLIFSRQEPSEKKLCDITKSIESVLSLTEKQLKKNNIEVVRKYERTPQVEVNKTEIQQVFLNIVTNARDSMLTKGGRLEIHVRHAGKNVEVRFIDTGKGIRKENLKRVFEPFYTTKGAVGGEEEVQGAGLGLFVSYGIVKRHEGTIEVESELGKVTTFTVKLPAKEEELKK